MTLRQQLTTLRQTPGRGWGGVGDWAHAWAGVRGGGATWADAWVAMGWLGSNLGSCLVSVCVGGGWGVGKEV